MHNQHKTISVSAKSMSVQYMDTNKHFVYPLEFSPNREIIVFGKSFKGVKASEVKTRSLNYRSREVLHDVLYGRLRYTPEQIAEMPLIRQYYILDIARRAERALYSWKRDLVTNTVDSWLTVLFPKSKLVQHMVDVSEDKRTGMDVTRIDIRSLVSDAEIIRFLQERHILPQHI